MTGMAKIVSGIAAACISHLSVYVFAYIYAVGYTIFIIHAVCKWLTV